LLSDGTIRQLLNEHRIKITPAPPESAFQPASVDLTLGRRFRVMEKGESTIYTLPRRVSPMVVYDEFLLSPGVPVLAHTEEIIAIPSDIVARVEGKSTWGRRFVMVHMTAGFIDPGFCGQITLEMINLSPDALWLKPGESICQLSFEYMDAPALRAYGHPELGSKYQGQRGPAAARTESPTIPSPPQMIVVKYDGGPAYPGDLVTNDGSSIE
jgi:dCTP deaminase